MSTLRRRALGLGLFIVIALFITVSILAFKQSFTRFTVVTLTTDAIGNELPRNADVKANGVVVGEVRGVESGANGTVLVKLGLFPGRASELSSDTTAAILPKTLFGERYVSLDPGSADSTTLHSGDVIKASTSGNSKQLQDLFDQLLPVLRAIPPQDLNTTLTTLSASLSGRGKDLGTTIDNLDTVFAGLRGVLPQLQGTFRGLASFSKTYTQALPAIVDALDSFRTTAQTAVDRQSDLSSLFATVGQAATDSTGWLNRSGQDFIDLHVDGEDFFRGFGEQAPSFDCTFGTLAKYMPEISRVVGKGSLNPGAHVKVVFSSPRGRYLPYQDEPRFYHFKVPPRCYAAGTRTGQPFPQYPGGGIGGDGSYAPPSRNPGDQNLSSLPQPDLSVVPLTTVVRSVYDDPALMAQLKLIYADAAGKQELDDVPSWVTLIGAPGLKESEVYLK